MHGGDQSHSQKPGQATPPRAFGRMSPDLHLANDLHLGIWFNLNASNLHAIYKVKHYNVLLCKCQKLHSFSINMHQKSFVGRAIAVFICCSHCVCPSVTSWSSTKMAKPMMTQTLLFDSPHTCVFSGATDLRKIPTGSPRLLRCKVHQVG